MPVVHRARRWVYAIEVCATCNHESPALDVIELLRQKGADVRYHDPYVAQFAHNGHGLRSEAELEPALHAADCVVIVTDHSVYDWRHVSQTAAALVDTRNVVSQAF